MDETLRLDEELRCGIVLAGQDSDTTKRQSQRAEALGFDSLWVGDHVAFHVPIAESLTTLAFAAGATERIALGTAVYLLALRHPTHVAKITATLDRLSGGRLVLGVGLGGEFPPEWQAVGVPVAERASRVEESIPLVRRLWSEDRVAHAGRHFAFDPVTIAPKPNPQRASGAAGPPPIWIGGRAPAAMRRAGRLADGYISHMCAPETYRSNLDTIAASAREAGRASLAFGSAAFLFTFLEQRVEDAHEKAAKLLGMVYARDFREAARKYCLLGPPDACLEKMRAFARAGCRHFILAPLSDPESFAERVAAEILPSVRTLAT
ncbi:LLM class flavin-dependent oxidoreductase [Myxococcota bacterium]|nr:LLM class flavin-dependent oxidoreductase [Myxococcota bacterium]MCZ7620559.1 LLM class flavin-dependent oxidoreductase [Myxococcota bacterium]